MRPELFASILLLATACADCALATEESPGDDSTVSFGIAYVGDFTGVVSGGAARRLRYLDDLQIAVDFDLERSAGWAGSRAHVAFLTNSGDQPNNDAQTLQGVDNIEVEQGGARLYEAWIELALPAGSGSMLVGLYDLNSEFYVSESAGFLIAPAFGIGSEMAATGPNGPSIFPSTAMAIRVRKDFDDRGYVQAAVVNAQPGLPGHREGLSNHLDEGPC